jgi:biopolymer transport protein ExbB/TolQ
MKKLLAVISISLFLFVSIATATETYEIDIKKKQEQIVSRYEKLAKNRDAINDELLKLEGEIRLLNEILKMNEKTEKETDKKGSKQDKKK